MSWLGDAWKACSAKVRCLSTIASTSDNIVLSRADADCRPFFSSIEDGRGPEMAGSGCSMLSPNFVKRMEKSSATRLTPLLSRTLTLPCILSPKGRRSSHRPFLKPFSRTSASVSAEGYTATCGTKALRTRLRGSPGLSAAFSGRPRPWLTSKTVLARYCDGEPRPDGDMDREPGGESVEA